MSIDPRITTIVEELKTRFNQIYSHDPYLTGFSETLGPVRLNPAPELITSYWKQILNNFMKNNIKQRNLNVRNVENADVKLYQDDTIIFANCPEFKNIQLDKKGNVIVPLLDNAKIREVAEDLNHGVLDIKLYNRIKDHFLYRRNNIKLAKNILDGIPETPEKIKIVPVFGPAPKRSKTDHVSSPGDVDKPVMNQEIEEPKREYQKGENTNLNNNINLINLMQKYPENSNLENYLLLENKLEVGVITDFYFLKDADVEVIWNALKEKIGEPKFKQLTEEVTFEKEKTMFLTRKFSDTEKLYFQEKRKIIKRRLLSLMVLISRNSKNINQRKLQDFIADAFESTSSGKAIHQLTILIRSYFIRFINTSGVVTEKYLSSIINGDFMNNIYQNEKIILSSTIETQIDNLRDEELKKAKNIASEKAKKQLAILNDRYKNEKKLYPLSPMLIRIRTKLWLIDHEIVRLPMSYIFDKYSDEDRKMIMREKEICKEISNLTNELGSYPIPNVSLPSSLFTSNDEKMQDVSYLLERSGPKILTEAEKKKKTLSVRGRSSSRRGGGKPTRKNYKK